MDDFKPCQRTVQMCIEALPKVATVYGDGHTMEVLECVQALEALLSDPAKALVEEWPAFRQMDAKTKRYLTDCARWLVAEGKING